jgi:WD40 repeat protein
MDPLRCLLLCGALTFPGQPAQDDPLPAHAVARFGTTRWQMPDQIYNLTWSADGKLLVACSTYRLIVFDAASGKQLYEVIPKRDGNPNPNDIIYALSGDSKVLAVGTFHWGHVNLVDAPTGKLRGRLWVDKSEMTNAIALSGDGQYLASLARPMVKFWETATGKKLWETKFSGSSIAFGAASKKLLVARENEVQILDVGTGQEVRSFPGEGRVLALSADGRVLAVLGEDTLRIWDPETGKKRGQIAVPAKSLGSWARVVLSANGKTVAVEPHLMSAAMLAWDVETGKELLKSKIKCSDYERAMALSPDGQTLAWGHARVVRHWDMIAGKELRPPSQGNVDTIYSLRFLPDRQTLVSGIWDSELRYWKVAPVPGGEGKPPPQEFVMGTLSDNGKFLATYDWKGSSISVKDLTLGKAVSKDVSFDPNLWDLGSNRALSPDGRYLAAFFMAHNHRDDHWSAVWDLTTGKMLHRWTDRFSETQFFFTPDGKHLILRESKRLRWWDLATMKEVRSWRYDGRKDVEVITPDGKIVVIGNSKIELRETITGKTLQHEARGSSITALAVSHDGKFLAAGDEVGITRLYDLPSGYLRAIFRGHSAHVASLAFSHDDKLLASGSGDTTVLLWDLAAALRHYAAAPPKPLTPKELERLWDDLAGEEDDIAIRAIWTLVADKDRALPFVTVRLLAIQKGCAPERIAAWIAQLDAPKYAQREEAERELRKLGSDSLPALEGALRGKPSLEVRQWIESLLPKIRAELDCPADRALQIIRGVEVLERIGTPAARDALQRFAAGPASRLQWQAQWVLDRLAMLPP